MQKIGGQGGMSLTTGFDVEFYFGGKDFLKNFYTSDNKDIVNMLCDEAQLPNVQSATAQITGRYLGEGPISYPHTRIYTDVSLGFLCDAKLTPLKFFTAWYDFIYKETSSTYSGTLSDALKVRSGKTNRTNRLEYMDNYTCTAKIIKTEPNNVASNGRAPIIFLLENCYPYSIDAVPLSYGSSQVTRVTVNLYYSRHTVSYGDPTSKTIPSPPTVNGVPIGRNDPFAPVTPENP